MVKFNKYVIVVSVLFAALFSFAAGLSLSECKESAARGNAEALYQLGVRYEKGDGVTKDRIKAVVQYQKAAAKKHLLACLRLAELYETGTFVAKDPIKAAQYRAIAKGESAAEAVADAKEKQEFEKTDFIEVALDYLLGRNGKERDVHGGVQFLYEVAKDNPTAQRVFVERWEKGDLDAGLEALSVEDWDLIIPWFEKQFKKGRRKGGLVLGNQARREKDYEKAVRYYRAAGEAGCTRAWLLLGNFYFYEEKDGGGPENMRSDAKAQAAYEKCLSIHEAEINIGWICLYSKAKFNLNYPRAIRIYKKAMDWYPKNKYYPYRCGYAMVLDIRKWWQPRWSQRDWNEKIRPSLMKLTYRSGYSHVRIELSDTEERTLKRYASDLGKYTRTMQDAIYYFRMAEGLGNENAAAYRKDLNDELQFYLERINLVNEAISKLGKGQ